MPYLNQVTIAGHAGKDGELVENEDPKKSRAKFSVAVSRGKDKPTDWFNVTVFGYSAKAVGKGDLVTVVGRMQQNDWTDKEGNVRKDWQLVGNFMTVETKEPF